MWKSLNIACWTMIDIDMDNSSNRKGFLLSRFLLPCFKSKCVRRTT